ncbi:A/G-specific adenine glycosylase [Solemya pervernicosa gill symbiont]|uniref:Adenine DNA glycosylase n=2 Tax=Gammaproteobacteria incertae sedis TaxID=118884 RepID=A0A1T2L0Y0_9GAMM|nr:A/G-specific adenine glycosylase [Candidatus Reidiella endopervernicosa]OOZ38732.1 A/G-specific adenine glycosylase [Solemya pervernicosa gill symbiont]QKQ25847.1 A/G-specific adenine glycosylase [Candidatus Reidiella endopervernicosa]
MAKQRFADRVLNWFDQHGRKDLPWQQNPNPYRVWLSEIMLQQTQVVTVIPYFDRFIEHFPDLVSLAAAELDEVLHLWSGLGYYARARNLHRCAQQIVNEHAGEFPDDIEAVTALPGIGRSTAGAILALSMHQRHPILDGNVKRVLARYHAVEGWSGKSGVQKQLWAYAETHTPNKRVADYTQAMMDLGATCCTRSQPNCEQCPLVSDCHAHLEGRTTELPSPKPKKSIPTRTTRMALIVNEADEVLLLQRPPNGIWGGLWSFPELTDEDEVEAWCSKHYHCQVEQIETWPVLRHTFSHFHLEITPLLIHTRSCSGGLMEAAQALWYNSRQPNRRGLAAPVTSLLKRLQQNIEGVSNESNG